MNQGELTDIQSAKKGRLDFEILVKMLTRGKPFQYIRFSDGETEIIRGNAIEIGPDGVSWSRGSSNFRYPEYDFKSFDPSKNGDLREYLVEAAIFRAQGYFKGIPTRHNKALSDRDMMVDLNGGDEANLTFADLLINRNYKRFLSEFLPLLQQRSCVVIANRRANPKLLSPTWQHLPIQDNAISNWSRDFEEIAKTIKLVPEGSIVLSSASSLTNCVGLLLARERRNVTLIDIGTSLNIQMGMIGPRRAYLAHLEPLTIDNLKLRLSYLFGGSSRYSW